MDPNQVIVHCKLSFEQINLILQGLGKLPFETVIDLVNGIRDVAWQALKDVEAKAVSSDEDIEERAS